MSYFEIIFPYFFKIDKIPNFRFLARKFRLCLQFCKIRLAKLLNMIFFLKLATEKSRVFYASIIMFAIKPEWK